MEVRSQSQLSMTNQQPITLKHDQLIANQKQARRMISTNEKPRELMTIISDKKLGRRTSGNVWIPWSCLIIDGQAEYSWREDYAVYLVGPARSAKTEQKYHRRGLLKTIDAFEPSIARKTAAIGQ
ncbi:hypothetical protein LAZ67_14002591 [Cordylochernes scorpioides]|uniref:Uncharacterized protein n=1 Tax=Cordylochernes scorpioides TaxID=51811 RepID=A0ABY6L754_9ARAC|nr:hypothetical protein LAZ67_14002591 [Cordylochernes scorpioides]